MDRGEWNEEMGREADMSHLRFLRKEDLRWPRKNIITVSRVYF
jgi:hypothetical protein